jgi:hypothetical protein
MKPEFKAVERPELGARDRAVHRVAEAVHRCNEAIQRAVAAGVSIEIVRVSRHHDGAGAWGDQMIPLAREPGEARPDATAA